MRPKLFLRDHQCITVRQRMTRHPFVHYNALFFCTLSVIHCGNLYFLVLHSFHVALFCGVIFSCCTSFCVVLFLFDGLFHVVLGMFSFSVLLYFILHLQCFRFAFFSCSTLRMLQVFPVALCSFCTISRSVVMIPTDMESDAQRWRVQQRSPFQMFARVLATSLLFHVALSSCCIF